MYKLSALDSALLTGGSFRGSCTSMRDVVQVVRASPAQTKLALRVGPSTASTKQMRRLQRITPVVAVEVLRLYPSRPKLPH